MSRDPTFAILGAAGFIAPRHIDAIHQVGGRLLAACDPHDAVGVLDRYGEDVLYFPQFERFDRWLDHQNRGMDPVDYVIVCTPNYLHDAHCRLALRSGSDVICEKPVTLTERNLDALLEVEEETGQRVSTILQLRHHPLAAALREIPEALVSIDYRAPRGPWYAYSWKGDLGKSGGVVTNIGVHLFDLMLWCFGEPVEHSKAVNSATSSSGIAWLERAEVAWHLTTESGPARRMFVVNDEQHDLTDAIKTLHLESYRAILAGEGWGLEDARAAVALCEELR